MWADVLEPLLDSLENDLRQRSMILENGIGSHVQLRADLNMTREVFDNLLSNAVKYGREGGRIRLEAQRKGPWWEFSVFNEGPGIPPEKREWIFQKFARLDIASGQPRPKGTGLGLFITRTIVEAHGGQIRVESEPGQWARFVFTLPADEERTEETPS